tara:strand:- start:3625 stop:4101 length:477 start_codon:yes stop_codon:yes gene_type:complete
MKIIIINKYILHLILILFLFNCTSSPRYGSGNYLPKNNSTSKISKNFKNKKILIGESSYYADDFHGKITANGETYDMYGLTAAHKTLPLNTIIKVTNLSNKKTAILRVNDRGPYAKGRILDCSYGAAIKLGFLDQGVTRVKIEVIEWGDNKYMKRKDQ